MRILYITPEVAPFSSSGDLGEFSRSLPRSLRELGLEVTVMTPFYQGIVPERFGLARRMRKLSVGLGGSTVEVGLLDGKFPSIDVSVIFIDHPESFQRDGLYGSGGVDFPDNAARFYLFCNACCKAMEELDLRPDLLHLNDWQTGFLPILLRQRQGTNQPAVVFTAHDPAFAGLFPPRILDELGLGWDLYHPDGIEFHGQVSLLKAGLLYSDLVTTHSGTFAREVQQEATGFGFDGVFRLIRNRFHGILPGVDEESWDPEGDHRLAATYTASDLSGKAACKHALQEQVGLDIQLRKPLVLVPGPFDGSSGIDVVIQVLQNMQNDRFQVLLAGRAPAAVADQLRDLVDKTRGSLVHYADVGEPDQHRFLAGADFILLPRRHEPGGLWTHRALRYGTVPVVHSVGGLRESVVELDEGSLTGTGLTFAACTEDEIGMALQRAADIFARWSLLQTLRTNGMAQHHPWRNTAQRYLELYHALLS